MSDELLREMRLQTAILRAGFRDRLDALGKEVAADPVSQAIISHLQEVGQTKSGALKEAAPKLVSNGTDVSGRTILRRLAELENKGVIERIGTGGNIEYRLTGLIN